MERKKRHTNFTVLYILDYFAYRNNWGNEDDWICIGHQYLSVFILLAEMEAGVLLSIRNNFLTVRAVQR